MFSSQAIICIVIFVLTIILYALQKISMGVVAMLSMSALILTGCLDTSTALGVFGNPNGIIMVGMIIVVTGFSRTQMIYKLTDQVCKISGGSFNRCMRLLILVYFLSIPFINSGLARYIMFYPIIVAACNRLNVSPSKALYPFAMIGMMGLTRIPIGSTAVLHLRNNATLEAYGITDYAMKITDYFLANTPGAIAILLYCLLFAFKFTPAEPDMPIGQLESGKKGERAPLKPFSEFCGYAIFFLTSLGVVLGSKIGLDAWLVVLIGAVLTQLTGVLTTKEIIQAIPLRMFLVFVGSLCMANAMVQSGAGEVIGNLIVSLVGGMRNNYLISAIFFIVPLILTQFLQNNATIQAFIPIAAIAAKALGGNPIGPVILVTTACSCCIFTPMATPSIAMVMTTGGYSIKTLFKQGLPPVILFAIVEILWVATVFPIW